MSPRLALAILGAAAAVLVAEGVARVQGDRLCLETPGAVYQADPRIGWRHVPHLAGWVGRCGDNTMPAAFVEANAHGLLDPERPYEKPPHTRRILLLGGNLPEGLGVRREATVAHLLEEHADDRRGAHLEVINAGIGGFALDNDLLYFREEGVRFSPDLVVLVVNPAVELASISMPLIRAAGLRVPAKTFFMLDEESQLAPIPFPAPPAANALRQDGFLTHSQLYRVARHVPTHRGSPTTWLESPPSSEPTDLGLERERARYLARALVKALHDETEAAGARLVLAVTPAGLAAGKTIEAGDEGPFLFMAAELGVPAVNLSGAFRWFESQTGRGGYFEGVPRWDFEGHFIAATGIWNFLVRKALLPPDVVPALGPGGGRVANLASFWSDVWGGRHTLFSTFVQYGLVCVFVLWAGAVLPPAARDWLVVVVSVALVAVLGTFALALGALVLALLFFVMVEAFSGWATGVLVVCLLAALVAAPIVWGLQWIPGEGTDVREYVAAATGVALLRLWGYAYDRRRAGLARRPLREFLAGTLFFPTALSGPIETPHDFATHRAPGAGAPESWDALATHLRVSGRAIARIAFGVLKVHAATLLFGRSTPDVFVTRGYVFGHPRLWLWTGELFAYFYLALSGFTDVAVGFGAMLGSTVTENFAAPWMATNPAEFWRRFHVSLGEWLRRYVYLPLGGNRRHATLNVFVVFVVSSLWYFWATLKLFGPVAYQPAARGGVLLWGLLNAVAVVVAHRVGRARQGPNLSPAGRLRVAVGRAVTLAVVAVAWVPFFLPPWSNLGECLGVLRRLLFFA